MTRFEEQRPDRRRHREGFLPRLSSDRDTNATNKGDAATVSGRSTEDGADGATRRIDSATNGRRLSPIVRDGATCPRRGATSLADTPTRPAYPATDAPERATLRPKA